MSGASANLRRHVQQLVEVHRTAALSDHQLLQRFAAQREEAAFALLVRRHGPMVLGLCRRVLGHEQDAEDAFQAAFLILARKAGAIRQTDVGGFLYRVTYRLAVRARGQAAKREQRVGAASRAAPRPARLAGPTSPDPLTDVTWREVRQLVDEELQRLPEMLRSALVLCYLEGKTQEQAAARLGWSKSTLRRRLDRGRELLRRRLLARGLAPAAALTATLFAEGAASAMTPALADATVRGAVQAAPLTPAVAALVEGGALLPAGKTKMALAILLAVSLLGGAAACGFALSRKRPAQPSAATAAPPKREAAKNVEIQGRVLDPAGKPKAGAKLLLLGKDKSTELGVSAADGRFTVAVPKAAKGHYLIAQAKGTGLDFLDLPQGEPKKPVELRLVNDRPIRGQIVNTEGKPVAGVRVAVDNLGVYPNNSLDSFLAIWKKQQSVTSGLPNGEKHIWEGTDTLLVATTDTEGRFTIPHVGGERLVSLRLSEGGIADAEIWVVNRRGFDPKPYNEAVLNNSGRKAIDVFGNRWRLHGPDLSVVAEAGKTIRGVVKDADTGKGRPGVEVILSKDGDGNLLPGPLVKAKTDERGRYEIRGAHKGKSYMLEVMADSAAGYMPCQIRVADTPGYQAIAADVPVKKGVIVTGKVIEKETGKAIPGWVHVGILHDNPFVKDYPAFGSSAWIYAPRTDDDGVFRVVTVPGPVLLMGGPDQQRLVDTQAGHLKYKPVSPDPDYPQYFSKKGQRNSLGVPYVYYGRDGGITPVSGNFCKVLETKAAVVVVKQDILLEAGTALPIRIRDAEDRPVAKTWVAGRSPMEGWPIACAADACAAYNLEPGKPRLMVFFEPTRKLAGTWTLKGDEKQPVVVKLGPAGAIEGRLLDANGKPLGEVVVDVEYQDREAKDIHAVVHKAKQIVTDADGAFTLDELIPGLKFELSFRRGKHRFEPIVKPVETRFEVKPGEKRDAGAIKLQRVAEKAEE